MAGTNDEIRQFIVGELHASDGVGDLTDDYPLLERAVIDSAGLVQLVVFLEERFGIVVDEEDLVPEHFGTIAAVAALVESRGA
jgi:acyl carrier protein